MDGVRSFISDESIFSVVGWIRGVVASQRPPLQRPSNSMTLRKIGGLQSPESNLNELTRDYGIIIDSTTVVRATYHKYMHPKQASTIFSDFRKFVIFPLTLTLSFSRNRR